MRTLASTAIAVAMGLACVSSAVAQEKVVPLPSPEARALPQAAPSAARPEVPLQVQIVISRYQGDKRVSSLPYVLSMNNTQGSGGRANLRLNSEMPVPTTMVTPASDGKPETSITSYMNRQTGTNIDVQCLAGSTESRFILSVTVSETWFRAADTVERAAKSLPPVAQTYQSSNTVYVKDGEVAQFTAATDRTTGEVIRVEVTARVLK